MLASTVLRREPLGLLGRDLHRAHMRLQFARGRLELRRHRAARAAPGRPEIHQQRDAARSEVTPEPRLVQRHRLALEQRRLAGATARVVTEPRGRDPVDRVALRAHDLDVAFHLLAPTHPRR